MLSNHQRNKLCFFCTIDWLEAFLCSGSNAPGFPDCSQLTTYMYLVAFQCLNRGPLIPTIIKSLTESVSNLFLRAVVQVHHLYKLGLGLIKSQFIKPEVDAAILDRIACFGKMTKLWGICLTSQGQHR